jgi:hypothetical protein
VAQGTDTSGHVGSTPAIKGDFDESRTRLFPGRFFEVGGMPDKDWRHPAGAGAPLLFAGECGTGEVLPFPNNE